jgi:hypothetical protein
MMEKIRTRYLIECDSGERIQGQYNRKVLPETVVRNADRQRIEWRRITTEYAYYNSTGGE